MLDVQNLGVSYGKVQAVKGISFHVNKGEIVTIIGSNGAGKSSTLKSIAGLLSPSGGEVVFDGTPITRMSAERLVANGLSLVPEGRQVFPGHTVLDNLLLGAYLHPEKAYVEAHLKHMFTLFPRLEERQEQLAGTLSGGEQQMLAIARALMSSPKLILMDEPSLGLAPIIVQEIFALFATLRDEGTTILLVEQMAAMALKVADRAYVLETGKIVLEGTAEEVSRDEKVVQAYLGSA